MKQMTHYRNVQILLAVVLVAAIGVWLLTTAGFWQAVFVLINVGAFYCYGLDKHRAIRCSRQRIPERALLGIAAIGGVPGSILGQLIFRHKTRKQPFRMVFWVIAILQGIVLTYLCVTN